MVQVHVCEGILVGGHFTSEPLPVFGKFPTVCVLVRGRATSHYRNGENRCHRSGHRSHSCSSSEALGLSSDGGTKETGSRKFFFSDFGFKEYGEFSMVVLVVAASVCKDDSAVTKAHTPLHPGSGGQQCWGVELWHLAFQDDGSRSSFSCVVIWAWCELPDLPWFLTSRWFSELFGILSINSFSV